MKPIKQFIAAKAFIEYRGRVLIVRESTIHPTNTQVGKNDVIGGRIEPGEKVRDALMREVHEECGLDISIGRPFFVNDSRNVIRGEECQIIRIFFRCLAKHDRITLNEEHDSYAWIDPANYLNANVIENLYPAFTAFLKIKKTVH